VREPLNDGRLQGDRIGICMPVLGELWSGVECSSSRERNLASLRQAVSTLIVWPFTTASAAEYGRLFAELRRMGRTIQQIDMQIGAIARTLPNCVVVSKDSDLSAIAGITVENWAR
jgi:tRNA(fMet)-specific endonuclease VapC